MGVFAAPRTHDEDFLSRLLLFFLQEVVAPPPSFGSLGDGVVVMWCPTRENETAVAMDGRTINDTD